MRSRSWLVVPLLILAACATPGSTPRPTLGWSVDGVELGVPIDCRPRACPIINKAAIAWLDEVAPGHPEVMSIGHFALVERDTNGDLALVTRSGEIRAILLTLADGTERATTVGCGPYDCYQLDPVIHDPPASP